MDQSTTHAHASSLPVKIDPTSLEQEATKDIGVGHVDYHGINTSEVLPGADAAYELKIKIMNESLIDIGMGPFQWKIFFMTGFGWFVDNVSRELGSTVTSIETLTHVVVLDASHHDHQPTYTEGVRGEADLHDCRGQVCWIGHRIFVVANDSRYHWQENSIQQVCHYEGTSLV